eukprot:scaffold90616_cov16-Prasinocladus_malaysianus.AAC.1
MEAGLSETRQAKGPLCDHSLHQHARLADLKETMSVKFAGRMRSQLRSEMRRIYGILRKKNIGVSCQRPPAEIDDRPTGATGVDQQHTEPTDTNATGSNSKLKQRIKRPFA